MNVIYVELKGMYVANNWCKYCALQFRRYLHGKESLTKRKKWWPDPQYIGHRRFVSLCLSKAPFPRRPAFIPFSFKILREEADWRKQYFSCCDLLYIYGWGFRIGWLQSGSKSHVCWRSTAGSFEYVSVLVPAVQFAELKDLHSDSRSSLWDVSLGQMWNRLLLIFCKRGYSR